MCPEAEQSRRTEARTVHIRSGRLPSTETGLALCTDRPRAEDPGRSGRSELSGSGPAPGGQERDRLEFQLSLSLHDGSWPSVGPTGPSKDPESRGAMGWKLLLPSHGTASDYRYGSAGHSQQVCASGTPQTSTRTLRLRKSSSRAFERYLNHLLIPTARLFQHFAHLAQPL